MSDHLTANASALNAGGVIMLYLVLAHGVWPVFIGAIFAFASIPHRLPATGGECDTTSAVLGVALPLVFATVLVCTRRVKLQGATHAAYLITWLALWGAVHAYTPPSPDGFRLCWVSRACCAVAFLWYCALLALVRERGEGAAP